ncbi:MAG: TolC family protein [Elusimicrobia bacterium]|nr:TolC family protein [Elusimicrobiota bacterium]
MKPSALHRLTKGGKTRTRILETAMRMMSDKGPDAVSMREISARLKITKPVLYYYFKNKEELIKASFIEGTKHFRELQAQVSDPGITIEEKISRLFSNHLDFLKKYPSMPRCALKVIASPAGGFLNDMAMEMKRETRKMLRALLNDAARKGGIAGDAVDDVLHLISGTLSHFLIEAKEGGMAELDKGLPARLARRICAGAKHLKTALIILFLSALAGPARAETLALSLNDAVETALRNNATVAVAQETRGIYKEKIEEYRSTVYPQLSAGAQYTRNIESPSFFIAGDKLKFGLNNAYTASLDLNQVVWAGGKVYTAIKMANLYSSASDEQLKTAQKDITKAVKQLYYAVLLSSSMAGIQQETLDLARQHLSMIEAQYSQGIASDLAVLRQKVEVSNTEPALTQARNLYETGLIELTKLLGLDPETGIALTGGLACANNGPGEIGSLYKAALLNRPEYRNSRLERDLYREMTTIERAGHYPYVSAYASRQFQGQSDSGLPGADERSWSLTAGLRLSLPLFSGGSVTSRVKQARMQADIAETKLRELERAIKIEVKKAWLGLKEASERLQSRAEAVDTARKALEATEVRFKNGLSSQLDLNDTTLALNRSQTLHTRARHDVCSADAELKWALGE